ECDDPAAPLFSVPESSLLAEFPSPDQAHRVVESIGGDNRTHANIAATAGSNQGQIPSGTLSPLLRRLTEEKRVLAVDHPLSTKPGKPALYRVADSNLRFYLPIGRAIQEQVAADAPTSARPATLMDQLAPSRSHATWESVPTRRSLASWTSCRQRRPDPLSGISTPTTFGKNRGRQHRIADNFHRRPATSWKTSQLVQQWFAEPTPDETRCCATASTIQVAAPPAWTPRHTNAGSTPDRTLYPLDTGAPSPPWSGRPETYRGPTLAPEAKKEITQSEVVQVYPHRHLHPLSGAVDLLWSTQGPAWNISILIYFGHAFSPTTRARSRPSARRPRQASASDYSW
ncbi:hypothetical protein K7G98_25320, partial [Saccharothrix sp. MB29]|nr:hypothetical protein [Saccharothrix sp. MB29]